MKAPILDTRGPDYLDLALTHLHTTYEYVVYGTPTMMELPAGAVLGTWCISVPGKVRYILSREMELAPGILPGDIARAWVRYNYDLPIKRRKDQKRRYTLPVMARRGHYPEGVYLDIRHAYLDVIKSAGYDCDYRLGKYLAAHPCRLPDIVAGTKWVYAIIVAMSAGSRSGMIVKTKEHGLMTRRSFNVFSNPCLYALASEVLASVASQVMARFKDKVYYVNTDGYIVDPEVAQGVSCVTRDWGFEIREKARGETDVFGVGSWRCGSERTTRYDSRAGDFCSELPTQEEARWLQCTFARWHNLIVLAENEERNNS